MKNRLKLLRVERDLTQADVAKSIGISRSTYSNIENGKSNPDFKTLVLLVSFFKIPANEIFFDLNVVYKQQKITSN